MNLSISMGKTDKKIKVVTHSGTFHPDDIFAVATLSLLLNNEIEIIRTRDPKIFEEGDYVVDVGGQYDPKKNRFDHHQSGGAGKRENGVPYAAFGLVWKNYGTKLCEKAVADVFDKDMIQYIDAFDNGLGALAPIFNDVYPFTIGFAFSSLNHTWKEKGNNFDSFVYAVDLAKKFIVRQLKIISDELEGIEKVRAIYNKSADKKIIIFDENYPWHEVLVEFPEPIYIVEPSDDDGNSGAWKVKTVRKDIHSFENRKDLPRDWAGKTGKDLAKVTSVPEAIFCHNKLFIAVARSKEGAIKLAQIALQS